MTIDERIAAELRRHAPEVDEHAAWEQIQSKKSVGRRSRTVRLVAIPVAAAGLLLVGSILIATLSSAPGPIGSPQSSLVGEPEIPIPGPTIPAIVWPQSNMEELRQAQQLADAGDPRYTWQVDPELGWQESAAQDRAVFESSEIVARFIREELGWEAFQYWPGGHGNSEINYLGDNTFIRCAADAVNLLYPGDERGGECAPTIDEFRYEWVSIDLVRLDSNTFTFDSGRDDPSGIWFVSAWRMLEPMEQMTPPPEVEIASVLNGFLQARIEGEGAERHVDVAAERAGGEIWWKKPEPGDIPLLYTTSTGAAYERSEFEVVAGPMWPDGEMKFKVRLFAESGRTVVEQLFVMRRSETGQLGLEFCSIYPEGLCGFDGPPTTENGQPVPGR
jgi:hypothetical protein